MKKLVLLAVLTAAGIASAQTYVQPHVRKDGTFVEGHVRSAPNSTPLDNYSTRGNSNPFTGQQGTVNPWAQPSPFTQPQQPSYGTQCGIASNGQYVCR